MKRAKTIPDEERFRGMLRSRGMRATETRMAVHRAMMALEHACAEQVVEWLKADRDVAASVSSIYNVLQQMAIAGIYAYRMSADSKRYFDVCNHSHAHLYDRKTGVYRNLPDGPIREAINAAIKRHRVHGYTVEDVDLMVVCHKKGTSR